jgi:hypothetical protein
MGFPLSNVPMREKKDSGGPIQAAFPFPSPIGGNMERAGENILSVKESL